MSSTSLLVGLCTAVAGLIRFATLDAKSYWIDEVFTVRVVEQDFVSMLTTIPETEATPPVYYVVAWAWAHVFGLGEAGMRSLPALIGTMLVPVAYVAGRELASSRTGLAAAALIGVNPLLVWYSQEARAYTLLVLLGALSFLFFVLSLRRPRPRTLLFWALASALALATHYFALFLVAAEAVWLVMRLRPRRDICVSIAFVTCVGALLLPMALTQFDNPRWIAESGLGTRLATIPAIFLIGFEVPLPYAFAAAVVAGALAAVGLWLLVRRAPQRARRGGLLALGIGAAAVVVPAVLPIVGLDFVVYKNVIVAVFPLTLAVATGLGTERGGALGLVALASLVSLSAVISVATSWEPKYHREDWRSAAEAIPVAAGPQVVVVTPTDGAYPLELYLGASRLEAGSGRIEASDIILVAGARRPLGSIEAPSPPRPPTPSAPTSGFTMVQRREDEHFTLITYRRTSPTDLSIARLHEMALDSPSTLLVRPSESPNRP